MYKERQKVVVDEPHVGLQSTSTTNDNLARVQDLLNSVVQRLHKCSIFSNNLFTECIPIIWKEGMCAKLVPEFCNYFCFLNIKTPICLGIRKPFSFD